MLLAKQSLGNRYKITNSINLKYLKITNEALCSDRLCRYVIRRLSRSSNSHVTPQQPQVRRHLPWKAKQYSRAAVQSSYFDGNEEDALVIFITPFFNLISLNVYYSLHYSTRAFRNVCSSILLSDICQELIFYFKILALTVKTKISLRF